MKNPTRIFFCDSCKKHIKSDEYFTSDGFNFEDKCECGKVLKISGHENNLYLGNNITLNDINSLECIGGQLSYSDVVSLFMKTAIYNVIATFMSYISFSFLFLEYDFRLWTFEARFAFLIVTIIGWLLAVWYGYVNRHGRYDWE